ncbi:MAG: cell division protein FtsZ [Micropepsaceae bacterium]
MPINLRAPEVTEMKPRITVLGVGGAGGNAVNNMINAKLDGVNFVVANTDAQALAQSKAESRIQLGARLTEGLGAGAKPDVGRAAAEESLEEILETLGDSHMVFVTAGMGGGTGTGAAPVITRAVRELGILTVGVITKPFHFEGDRRMKLADRGIEELQNFVDTLIIIPNQNLFRVANERTTFAQAFSMADDVLHSGVRGITDLIVMPGLINRDFADIKTVMSEMGKAMMGTGEMDGDNRALRAAEAAISNPLLDEVSMKGARAVLINVTGGPDLMLFEVDEAVNRIRAEVEADSNILFGSALSDDMEGRVRVSVVATGIDAEAALIGRDNIEQLWPNKPEAAAGSEAVSFSGTDFAEEAPAANNPVHDQVERLAQGLAVDTDPLEAAIASAPAAETPGEPMLLGGDSAPELEESSAAEGAMAEELGKQSLGEAVAKPQRTRRGFARLFGGGSKTKPEDEAKREPLVHASEPLREPTASAQTIGVHVRTAPFSETPSAPQVSVTKQAPPMPEFNGGNEHDQAERNGSDLFGESKQDKRADIPAFLRAQDKSGEDDDSDRFEIPAFLRRQAGSGS